MVRSVAKRKTKPKSIDTKARIALEHARSLRDKGLTWMEIHNALFGVGGQLSELFSTEPERAAFARTPAFKEIMQIVENVRDDDGDPPSLAGLMSSASGTTTLRIPKSLHAALLAEAGAEGISLNQLCLAKLAVQLRTAVAGS